MSRTTRKHWRTTRRVCLVAGLTAFSACSSSQKKQAQAAIPSRSVPPPQTLPLPKALPAVVNLTTPSHDEIDRLVAKADDYYSQGVKEYQSGDLQKARVQFDQALEVLLQSNHDLRSDDRLNEEFEKIVQDTYSLEVAAVERGNTLSERPTVSPPIESFAKLTFPVNPKVKETVQEEVKSVHSDLPLVSNDLVDGVISYIQASGRSYMEKILRRMGEYGPMISKILKQNGLPQDLLYLAAGESALNPFAVSRARCVGIWQFSLGTGRLYGLRKTRWLDERSDPVKSTEAAARHLKDLYGMFGDWFLAMAAYDSGALTVQRAIERTGYADFWKLRELHALPLETQNYVPIFLATAIIAKDPKTYGFDVQPDPPLAADKVEVRTPTDLRLVAELIDHPVEDLIKLNPGLLQWTTPLNDPNFVLNLPTGTKDQYEKEIAAIPVRDRLWWRAHTVEDGETLATIARKNHLSLATVARANQLNRDDPVSVGKTLVLPFPPGHAWSLARLRGVQGRRTLRYRIRRGDTLSLIADRFDVTPYEIRRWNGLRSSRIVAGRVLEIYAPRRDPRPSRSRHTTSAGVHIYEIRQGDTLVAIARRFGVTVSQIEDANHLVGSHIMVGETLRIYVPASSSRLQAKERRK